MSSRDKTRQQLVGSMRKTKAVAGIGNEQVETEPASLDERSSKPARPETRTGAGNAFSAKKRVTLGTDAYQSGGRVWPD